MSQIRTRDPTAAQPFQKKRHVRLPRSKKNTSRKTKHGRLIQDESDVAKRECPYPYEPDL